MPSGIRRATRLVAVSAIACLTLTMAVTPVAADTGPYLVKDINTSGSSWPRELTVVDDKVFFSAAGGGKGRELWVSDGTPAGTKRLKDIKPGPQGSSPSQLAAIGGLLYFNADDGTHGAELWVSDGTGIGTRLVKDIRTGPADSDPYFMTGFNGAVYFSADDGHHGRELWRTDGTPTGTALFKNLAPGSGHSSPGGFTEFAGKLVFLRVFCPTAACYATLYKTDGTPAGTKPFRDRDGSEVTGQISWLTVIGSRLFFTRNETELWRSNGTSASMRKLGDFGAWDLTAMGDTLYFQDLNTLLKSDGTVAGTVEVATIIGEGTPILGSLTDVGGTLFFTADVKLWKSDGTEPGTVEVDPGEQVLTLDGGMEMAALGGIGYYTGPAGDSGSCHQQDYSLWRTDGTPGGTYEVAAEPSNCQFEALTPVGNSLYFVAGDDDHGIELWRYVP